MPKKKHNELIAGIFVVVTIGAMLGVLLWLGASDLFKKSYQRVTFYSNEATGSLGLALGGPVQVSDRVVGTISDIRLAGDGRTLYVVQIDVPDVQVHGDGLAQVSSQMVGPSKLVITRRGSAASPLADAEHAVRISGGLDQAMANISAAADIIKQIAETARSEFDASRSASLLASVHKVMNQLEAAATNIAAQTDARQSGSLVGKVLAGADDVKRATGSIAAQMDAGNSTGLLAKIHRSTDDVNAITADARPKIEKTLTAAQNTAQQLESVSKKDLVELLTNLRKASGDVLKISSNFVEVSEQARSIFVMNRDRIDEMIDNMDQVSFNLKATSKDVRRNPWRLLYKPEKEELHSQNIYDAARAFATGAEQLDSAIAKLRTLAKTSSAGIAANAPELLKVRKEIEQTFGNFSKAEEALWKELSK